MSDPTDERPLIEGITGDVVRFVVSPDGSFELHQRDGSITTGTARVGRGLTAPEVDA